MGVPSAVRMVAACAHRQSRCGHDRRGDAASRAEGADAPGWTDFERVLIRMTDEIRYEAMISDKTWAALRERYTLEQTIDAMYTASQYQLVSMALNSLGVQLDPVLSDRMPDDLRAIRRRELPKSARLSTPRRATDAAGEDHWRAARTGRAAHSRRHVAESCTRR
jgi:hypothetical protein